MKLILSRRLLMLSFATLFLGSLTLAFAGKKRPPSPEEICTGRQVSVYDGCRKEGGSEDHCWQYSRQKYKDCMNDAKLNKRLQESQAAASGGMNDRPTVQTSTPKPLPKKPVDTGRVQDLSRSAGQNSTTGDQMKAGVRGRLSRDSKASPSPSPKK